MSFHRMNICCVFTLLQAKEQASKKVKPKFNHVLGTIYYGGTVLFSAVLLLLGWFHFSSERVFCVVQTTLELTFLLTLPYDCWQCIYMP